MLALVVFFDFLSLGYGWYLCDHALLSCKYIISALREEEHADFTNNPPPPSQTHPASMLTASRSRAPESRKPPALPSPRCSA